MSRQCIVAGLICAPWLMAIGMAHAGNIHNELITQSGEAVVSILSYRQSESLPYQSSGILIADNRIVTNCHLLRDVAILKVKKADKLYPAKWTQADLARNVCVIRAEGLDAPDIKFRLMADVPVGEEVYAIGNLDGLHPEISPGLIATRNQMGNEQIMLASLTLSPGFSGGGLFDKQGRLLGITVPTLYTGEDLSFVFPADWIRDLSTRGEAPPKPEDIPVADPDWLSEARSLHYAGKFSEEEKLIREWRRKRPTSSLPLICLVENIMGNDPNQAKMLLQEAMHLDDSSVVIWTLIADIQYRQKQVQLAEESLRRAEAIYPAYAPMYWVKAKLLSENNRQSEAYEAIKMAIRLEPDRAESWTIRGTIADILGKKDESSRAFNVALKLNPLGGKRGELEQAQQSFQVTDEASKKFAEDLHQVDTLYRLALLEMTRKNYPEAEKAYRKILAVDPDYIRALTDLGGLLVSTKRYDEAWQVMDKAMSQKPTDKNVMIYLLTNRSLVKSMQNDIPAALQEVQAALALDPEAFGALRLYAGLKFKLQDYAAAGEAFKKLVKSDKAIASDWNQLGDCFLMLGDKINALAALQQAEKLEPDNELILQSLTRLYGLNGDYQTTLSYSERALKISPASAESWNNKGVSLLRMGHVPEAISALDTAVSLNPQLINIWVNLGEAYLRGNNLSKAIQYLEKALTMNPQAEDAILFLAESYLNSHQPELAILNADKLLTGKSSREMQALSIRTQALLALNNSNAALQSYQKIQALNPQFAREVRASIIAKNLSGGQSLPE